MPRRAASVRSDHSSTRSNKCPKIETEPVDSGETDESTKKKLIFILSPAKTLDTTPCPEEQVNQPIPWTAPNCDRSKTNEMIRIMKQKAKSVATLGKVLGISETLASTAKKYWDDIQEYAENEPDKELASSSKQKPCILTFDGAAYQGLDVNSLLQEKQGQTETFLYLQERLRIIDPLYGWLRPMDVIRPYRLEMATKDVAPGNVKNLAQYWKPVLDAAIAKEPCQENDKIWIVNVASDEYSGAVTMKSNQIKVIFQQDGRVAAVHAKRARGLFVRYCAVYKVQTVEELQKFDWEGYSYQASTKSCNDILIFDRPKNWNAKNGKRV